MPREDDLRRAAQWEADYKAGKLARRMDMLERKLQELETKIQALTDRAPAL